MKKNVRKQKTGISLISKMLTACIASAAIMTAAASSASAVEIGHSDSKVRFTVYENKEANAVIQFDQLGKSKGVFAAAQIAADKLDPGDYYFEAEEVFDSKISKAFENAIGKSRYTVIADYAIVDLSFTDKEENQVYPDADILFTSSDQLAFNLVYKYNGSDFTLVDNDYMGESLKIKDANKERLVLARIYYINDSGKDYVVEDDIMEDTSGIDIDNEGSGKEIIKTETDKINIKDSSFDKDDFEKAIKDIEKITPDNDSVETGDMTGAAAIISLSCAAAAAIVLLTAKTKKKDK